MGQEKKARFNARMLRIQGGDSFEQLVYNVYVVLSIGSIIKQKGSLRSRLQHFHRRDQISNNLLGFQGKREEAGA